MRPARRSPGGGGGAATRTAAAGPRRAGVRQEEAPPSRRRRPWAGNRGAAAARARAGLRGADKTAVVGLLPVTGPHLGPQPAPSAAARPGEGIGSGLAVMAPERALRGGGSVPPGRGPRAEVSDPGRRKGDLCPARPEPTSGGSLASSPVPPSQAGAGHTRGGHLGLAVGTWWPLSVGLVLVWRRRKSPGRGKLQPLRGTTCPTLRSRWQLQDPYQQDLRARARTGGYRIHTKSPPLLLFPSHLTARGTSHFPKHLLLLTLI